MSFEPPVSPSLLEQNKSKTKHKITENQTERNETKQTMWNVAVGEKRVSVSVCGRRRGHKVKSFLAP